MQLEGYQVVLQTITADDIEMLRTWRNDPKISQFMLSQEVISREQQQTWFEKVTTDLKQHHFVIYYKNRAIGAANIKAKDGANLSSAKIIEPGLYIFDDRYRGNILAFAPTLLLNDYCFESLSANSLEAIVLKENSAALNYNIKLGYKVTEEKSDFLISLTQSDYELAAGPLKKLLSR